MQLERPPSNLDSGPWKEVSLADGIRTVETPDFEAFFKFVNTGFGHLDCRYLWRGQKCAAWEITSGLARAENNNEQVQLGRFYRAVSRCTDREYDLSQDNPSKEIEEFRLWSLGQHHGLSTPLTDWTIYPFVALFFAFTENARTEKNVKIDLRLGCTGCIADSEVQTENSKSDCKFRAVFALNQDEVETVKFELVENRGIQPFKEKINNPPYPDEFKQYLLKNYGVNFGDNKNQIEESKVSLNVRDRLCKWEYARLKNEQLRVFRPRTHDNHRIHSQGGWHVYAPDNMSIETWVRTKRTVLNYCKIPLLTKILIPESERKTVLKCLNKMNVNYLSLFPDMEGATKHCNMALHESHDVLGSRDY